MTLRPEFGWGVRDLCVRYGRHLAVEGVTLAVPRRAVTAVVGGDGAGKSTLLRTLAGALRPASGTVSRPPARRIGYVSAASGVYTDLTVDENVAFVGRAYGLRRAQFQGRAAPLLARAGLADARARLAGRLSGGMRQKLAFVLAVLADPELLVLDEPTTGVDPVSRADIWRLIAGAAAQGAAVVLSTTYLDEAERAAHVLVLDRGRALLSGSPEQVMASVPGALYDLPPADMPAAAAPFSWRRGAARRIWMVDGAPPVPGAKPLTPGLADAVIVACMRAQMAVTERAAA